MNEFSKAVDVEMTFQIETKREVRNMLNMW